MSQFLHSILAGTDWGAVIIGLVALVFAAISLCVQRKHNRLSVKPIAIITFADYEDRISVYLQNQGTGPLIIKKLLFTDELDRKRSSLIEFFGAEFSGVIWSTFTGNINGWAILPGQHKTLIELVGDPQEHDFVANRKRVRKVLAQIKAEVHYQDIYEKDMPIRTRTFDWFAR
jgi:hypothetical protein